jgi:hypothetical protein
VDLVRFVCEAVEDESQSAQAVVHHSDSLLELQLPRAWAFGLDGLPGYDPDSRRLRLTTDVRETRDEQNRTVGYLGRAHPVVRRALDQVRNIRFGEAEAYLDRRVSAVACDGDEPALLFTFLGIVESGNGREFERVLGVHVTAGGSPVVMAEPSEWLMLADRRRQISPKNLWKTHFAGWAEARRNLANKALADCFNELAEPFVEKHRSDVATERNDLDKWLRARTQILCGQPQKVTGDLFGGSDHSLPTWKTLTEPTEQLAAFATDGENKPIERREADGVLRLYRQRSKDLDRRADIRILPPSSLGLLMLVPDGQTGG